MNFYPAFILSTRNKSIPLITPAPGFGNDAILGTLPGVDREMTFTVLEPKTGGNLFY